MAPSTNPSERDRFYGNKDNFKTAQYLVDLHDSEQVFNFCGSLLFQLKLSKKLREHLGNIAKQTSSGQQRLSEPQVFSCYRMSSMPGYSQSNFADNCTVFHGREVRNALGAKGGQGCVLHLSLASQGAKESSQGDADPEGWTQAELKDYNGWATDSKRHWRPAGEQKTDGFSEYENMFGAGAYGLHHRFFLHWDKRNVMWLSAEDGCEGEPWGV